MTELDQYQDQSSVVASTGLGALSATVRYAELLAASGLLPKEYRDQPANVLFAVEYGRTLGITPMAAITGIHVIDGKPAASAGLMSALVRRAGHKLRVTGDHRAATAQIIRADDPDYVFEFPFSLDDAVNAGLCEIRNGRPYTRDRYNKPKPWEAYTRSMLRARAISGVARAACEEVLFGLHYTPEELGAIVDQDGNPVELPGQPVPAQQGGEQSTTEPRDFVADAKTAAGADGALRVYREAQTAGAPQEVLDEIATIGRAKRAAEQQATDTDIAAAAAAHPANTKEATTPDPAPADTDRDAALAELHSAADHVQLSKTDLASGFRDSTGVDIDDATPDQIRHVTSILRGNAA